MPKTSHIDSAFFGYFIINGKKYEHDVIVSWNGKVLERKKTHHFTKNEFMNILIFEPEVVVIGTGFSNAVKLDPDVEVAAKINGVELIVKPTPNAVHEYNKLVKAKKKVIAVLHSTC